MRIGTSPRPVAGGGADTQKASGARSPLENKLKSARSVRTLQPERFRLDDETGASPNPVGRQCACLANQTPPSDSRSTPHYGEDDEQDESDDEQYPGDVGGGAGNAGEAEHGGDDGDDEKGYGPREHSGCLIPSG